MTYYCNEISSKYQYILLDSNVLLGRAQSFLTDPRILKFSEANCNARFGTCADIVSYLCKF